MEYGILVAIDEEYGFQVVGEVDSLEEASTLADEYLAFGPENNLLCPWEFQIHRRGPGGFYTTIERWHAGLPPTVVNAYGL
jgi:hypothetical protein